MANHLLTRVPKRALLSLSGGPGVATMVRTIYQQRSRVIDADRPKFGNRSTSGSGGDAVRSLSP